MSSAFRVTPAYDVLLRGDSDINVGIYQLHLATAEQLTRLHYSPGTLKTVKKRLKTLTDNGFVQADSVPTRQYKSPYFYTLGAKGIQYLEGIGIDVPQSFRESKEVGQHYLFVQHAIELNDILISASLLHTVTPIYSLTRFVHERILKRRPYTATWQENGKTQTQRLTPDAFLDFRVVTSSGQRVRWSQHLLSIIAEVLILLSFAMSGMDVSLGGVMATVPILIVLWAGMFALGIDTAFVLSWVRVRQCIAGRRWVALGWNVLLALAMSAILFQPVAVQLLQQSLDINFIEALSRLGIDIVTLTYARSAVAVLLGAILAMTNVESDMAELSAPVGPQRRIMLFEHLLNRIAPVVGEETATRIEVSEEIPFDIAAQPTAPLPLIDAQLPTQIEQLAVHTGTTPQERAAQVRKLDLGGLSSAERVKRVLGLFPDISDRELGKLGGISAATAKKYRKHTPTE